MADELAPMIPKRPYVGNSIGAGLIEEYKRHYPPAEPKEYFECRLKLCCV